MDESRVFNPLDLQLSRSVYHWNNHSMGTCLPGRLIPAYTWNILPGMEMKMDVKSLFKMSTPVYPTMDYLYADIAFFFVPYKLILSRRYASPTTNDAYQSWEGIIGAQDSLINMPIPASGVRVPIARLGLSNPVGSLANYLYGYDGFAEDVKKIHVNALPELSYFSIWNENYREPNIQSPVTWSFAYSTSAAKNYIDVQTGPQICIADCEVASFRSGDTPGTYVGAVSSGLSISNSTPLPTSVFHGYFGSLLPWPQRNLTGVSLPIAGFAPLVVGTTFNAFGGVPRLSGGTDTKTAGELGSPNVANITAQSGKLLGVTTNGTSGFVQMYGSDASSNIGADLSQANGISIEQLRALITQQHWYEDLQRSGNRLDELEYGTFGVRPKDSGCDRPVYLGGKRIQLNVEMVASTNGGVTSGAAQGAGSLGDLGAFSHTNDEGYYFHHGFDTWGAVQCVFTIRAHNLFSSGIDRQWLKDTREDWYWPEFAGLGNQATLMVELCPPSASNALDVLGYQEYAEEWREPRDLVTGLLDPRVSGGLGFMTYAHAFSAAPTLATLLDASRQYMDVDRTLAVGQAASGFQFIYQMTFDAIVRSPVGKYSYPGVGRI